MTNNPVTETGPHMVRAAQARRFAEQYCHMQPFCPLPAYSLMLVSHHLGDDDDALVANWTFAHTSRGSGRVPPPG